MRTPCSRRYSERMVEVACGEGQSIGFKHDHACFCACRARAPQHGASVRRAAAWKAAIDADLRHLRGHYNWIEQGQHNVQ